MSFGWHSTFIALKLCYGIEYSMLIDVFWLSLERRWLGVEKSYRIWCSGNLDEWACSKSLCKQLCWFFVRLSWGVALLWLLLLLPPYELRVPLSLEIKRYTLEAHTIAQNVFFFSLLNLVTNSFIIKLTPDFFKERCWILAFMEVRRGGHTFRFDAK